MSDLDSPSREESVAALAERDAVIEVLLAEIEQLKRRLGMDSSNSSMPPGSDGPAARARRAKQRGKRRSPRPRGGQAGHEGHSLQWVADPDVVEVSPGGCGGCGRDLADVPGRVASRVQVFDTPPVKVQVTEYRMLAACCPGCGQTTRAAAPAGVAGPCCYGPNVRAATALLACNGHMSIERLRAPRKDHAPERPRKKGPLDFAPPNTMMGTACFARRSALTGRVTPVTGTVTSQGAP